MFIVALLCGCSGGCSSNVTGLDGPSDGGATSQDAGVSGDDAQSASPGCGNTQPPTVADGVIEVAGVRRTYFFESPTNYDPDRTYPLVVGLHGSGRNSRGGTARNGYRLLEHYDGDAIVVYPDGSGAGTMVAWDLDPSGEDITFIMQLVQQIEQQLCVDRSRIHAFGYSFGGAMAHALACSHSDVFRAFGAASGWAPHPALCMNPVAAHLSHGIGDSVVPLTAGGEAHEQWLMLNGCTGAPISSEPDGCVSYDDCESNRPVEWCTFDGSHQFNGRYAAAAVELFESL